MDRFAIIEKFAAKMTQERHGESPTSKENVKKVEQGGIGKGSCAGVKMAAMADELRKIAAVQKIALSAELLRRAGAKAKDKARAALKWAKMTNYRGTSDVPASKRYIQWRKFENAADAVRRGKRPTPSVTEALAKRDITPR